MSKAIEIRNADNKPKIFGFLCSALIHAGLLMYFAYITFNVIPKATPEIIEPIELNVNEEGMLANFGTSKTGNGEIQPENNVGQTQTPAPVNQNESNNKATSNFELANNSNNKTPEADKILTQVVEESAHLNTGTKEVEKPIINDNNSNNESSKSDNNSKPSFADNFFKNSKNKNNSTGQGVGGKGDQGALNGDPNSKNMGDYSYGKGNKGVGYSMGGRKLSSFPSISDNSQATGKVVVKIKVDRKGNVLAAQFQQKNSTTMNTELRQKSEKAAMQAKFSPNPDAPEEQWGTIIIDFSMK